MALSGIRGTSGLDPTELQGRQASIRPDSGAPRAVTDRVSLSSAARSPIPERMRALSEQAHANPQLAKQLAYDYGHTPMGVGIDASSLPLRYKATGEACTPEKDALYAKQTSALKDASSALYASEKAKGTADADIFDQLMNLAASQPPDFRALVGWGPE